MCHVSDCDHEVQQIKGRYPTLVVNLQSEARLFLSERDDAIGKRYGPKKSQCPTAAWNLTVLPGAIHD